MKLFNIFLYILILSFILPVSAEPAPEDNNTGYVYVYGSVFKPNGEVVKRFVNTTNGKPLSGYADFYNFYLSKINEDTAQTYNCTAPTAIIGEKDGNEAAIGPGGKIVAEFPGYAGDCDTVKVWLRGKLTWKQRSNFLGFGSWKTKTNLWPASGLEEIVMTRRTDGPFYDEWYKGETLKFSHDNKSVWQNIEVRVHGKEIRVWHDVQSSTKHLGWWESVTNFFSNIWNALFGTQYKDQDFKVYVDAGKGINYADFLVKPAICSSYSTPQGGNTINCWIATKLVTKNVSHLEVKKDISYGFLDVTKDPLPGNIFFPVAVGVEAYDRAGNVKSAKVNPKVDIAVNPQGNSFYMVTEYSYDDETNTYRESTLYKNGEIKAVYDLPDDKHVAVATADPFNDFVYVNENDGVAVCETWQSEGVDIENRYFILKGSKIYENYQGAEGPAQGNLDSTNQDVGATDVSSALVGSNQTFQTGFGAPEAQQTAVAAMGSPDGVYTQLGRGGSLQVNFDIPLDSGDKVIIYEHSAGTETQYEFSPDSLAGASFNTIEKEQYTIEAASSGAESGVNSLIIRDSSAEPMIDETYYTTETHWVWFPPHNETTTIEHHRLVPDPAYLPEAFDANMHAFMNIDAVVLTNVEVNEVGLIAADGRGNIYTLKKHKDETYNFVYKVGTLSRSDTEIWYYERETNYDLWVANTENIDTTAQKISLGYDIGKSYYYRQRISDPPYSFGDQGYIESQYTELIKARDACDLCTINIAYPPLDTGTGVCDIQTTQNSVEVLDESGGRRNITEVFVNIHEGSKIGDNIFTIDQTGAKAPICFENWDQLNHFKLEPNKYKPYLYKPTLKYGRSDALAWLNYDWDGDAGALNAEGFGGGFPTNTVIGRHYQTQYADPPREYTEPGMEVPPYAFDKRTMDSRNFMWSIRRLGLTYENNDHEIVEVAKTTPWKRINGGGQNGYQDYLDYYFDGRWGDYLDSEGGNPAYQDYVDALVSYQDGQFFQPGDYKFDDGGIYQIRLEARYKYIDWMQMRQVMDGGTPQFWWNEPEYIEPESGNWMCMVDTEEVIVTAYKPVDRKKLIKVEIVDNHSDNNNLDAAMTTFIPFDEDSDNVPEFKYAEINEDVPHRWIVRVWQYDELTDSYSAVSAIKFVPNRRQQVEMFNTKMNTDENHPTKYDTFGKTVQVDRNIDKGDGIVVGDGATQNTDTVIEFNDLETDQTTDNLDNTANPGVLTLYDDDGREVSDKYTGICAIGSNGEPMQYSWSVITVPWDAEPFVPYSVDHNAETPGNTSPTSNGPMDNTDSITDGNTLPWPYNYYTNGTFETGLIVAETIKLRTDQTSTNWKGHSTTDAGYYNNFQPWDSKVYETEDNGTDDEGRKKNGYDQVYNEVMKPEYATSIKELSGVVNEDKKTELDTDSSAYGSNVISDFDTIFNTPIIPLRYRVIFELRYKRVDYLMKDEDGNPVPQEDNPMNIKDDYRDSAEAQVINYDCVENWESTSCAVDVFVKDRTLPKVEVLETTKIGGTTGDLFPRVIKCKITDNNPFDSIWPNVPSTSFNIGDDIDLDGEIGWNKDEGTKYRGSHAYVIYPLEIDRNNGAEDVRSKGNSDDNTPYPKYKWGRPETSGSFGLQDMYADPEDYLDRSITENGYFIKGLERSVTVFTLNMDTLYMPAFEQGDLKYYIIAEDGCHNYFNGTIDGAPKLVGPSGTSYSVLRPFAERWDATGNDNYVSGLITNAIDHNRVKLIDPASKGIHAIGVPLGFPVDADSITTMQGPSVLAEKGHEYLQKVGMNSRLNVADDPDPDALAEQADDIANMGIGVGYISVVDNDPPDIWFRVTNPKRANQTTYYCFDKNRIDNQTDFDGSGNESYDDKDQRSRSYYDETTFDESTGTLALKEYGDVDGDVDIDERNNTSRRGRIAIIVNNSSADAYRYEDPHYPGDFRVPLSIDVIGNIGGIDSADIRDPALPYGGLYDLAASDVTEATRYEDSIYPLTESPVSIAPLIIDEDVRVSLELFSVDNIDNGGPVLSLYYNNEADTGYDATNQVKPPSGKNSAVHMTNINTPGFDWNNDLVVDSGAATSYIGCSYLKGYIVFRESTRNNKNVSDIDSLNKETVTIIVKDNTGNTRSISFPIIIMDTQLVDNLIEDRRTRDRSKVGGGL